MMTNSLVLACVFYILCLVGTDATSYTQPLGGAYSATIYDDRASYVITYAPANKEPIHLIVNMLSLQELPPTSDTPISTQTMQSGFARDNPTAGVIVPYDLRVKEDESRQINIMRINLGGLSGDTSVKLWYMFNPGDRFRFEVGNTDYYFYENVVKTRLEVNNWFDDSVSRAGNRLRIQIELGFEVGTMDTSYEDMLHRNVTMRTRSFVVDPAAYLGLTQVKPLSGMPLVVRDLFATQYIFMTNQTAAGLSERTENFATHFASTGLFDGTHEFGLNITNSPFSNSFDPVAGKTSMLAVNVDAPWFQKSFMWDPSSGDPEVFQTQGNSRYIYFGIYVIVGFVALFAIAWYARRWRDRKEEQQVTQYGLGSSGGGGTDESKPLKDSEDD